MRVPVSQSLNGTYGQLELSFSPNADLISTVRRFVIDFYDRILGDTELSWKVGLATHELLENAVKYSLDEHSRIAIKIIEDSPGTNSIVIQTKNRASSRDMAEVQKLIGEMHQAKDAFDFYQELIKRTAKSETSGLGLGRICSESDMSIDCKADGEVLYVTAKTALGKAQ
jgi:hypothetical protein